MKGTRQSPAARTAKAMFLYAVLYRFISLTILFSSRAAKGLYKLYVIAEPTPISAKDSMAITSVNKPLRLTERIPT